MCGFNYEELRLIRLALGTEIIRREELQNTNMERLKQFEDLYDKVDNLMQDMKEKEEVV